MKFDPKSPNPLELNPHHETTQKVHNYWHTILALFMHQQGIKKATITMADIAKFNQEYGVGAGVTVQENQDGLHLTIVTNEEADKLARENGGLPN